MSFDIAGKQIYDSFIHASKMLQQEKEKLNSLNLFPVADKDTGINMYLTMKNTADHLTENGTPSQILENAYLNLLEFSHGNSGTILTLFFEGFKNKIPCSDRIGGRDLALAIENGAKTAFNGVMDPMPGTILTVAMRSAVAGISMLEITEDAGQIMKRISDEAHAALMQTPFQNLTLQPHKIVDSGALGFCLIMDGFLSGIAPELKVEPYPSLKLPDSSENRATELLYRYCTEFLIRLNQDENIELFREETQSLGKYFVITTNGSLCKVHIHTDMPEKVLSLASQYGIIKSSKVDDMLLQL